MYLSSITVFDICNDTVINEVINTKIKIENQFTSLIFKPFQIYYILQYSRYRILSTHSGRFIKVKREKEKYSKSEK